MSSNLSFVLSGGTTNIDPNASLGGDPSATPIANNRLNNLFDDVTQDEGDDGVVDYRCLYVFNDSEKTIYSLNIWIFYDFADGAVIELGTSSRDEVQRILLTGNPTGGSFTISYGGESLVSTYNSDIGTWATNLQAAINALEVDDKYLLRDTTVTAQTASGKVIFDLNFVGRDAKRSHDLFQLESNDLTGISSIAISAVQTGGPINVIAPAISIDTTPPAGVSFYAPSESSPIGLPYLKPDEGFPIWVKRTIPEGTGPYPEDGVTIRFHSTTLES